MSTGQYDEWHTSRSASQSQQRPPPPSPPVMSANVNGPVDPHEFYTSFSSTSSATKSLPSSSSFAASAVHPRMLPDNVPSFRSFSQSPERARSRPPSANTNPSGNQKLSNARSQPALSARQPGAVKDMANRFDGDGQGFGVRVPNERYRRPLPPKTGGTPRSSAESARGEPAKLQKRKVVQQSSPQTSFETVNNSFSSQGTSNSFIGSTPPIRIQQHIGNGLPLFGEITSDGAWNGNFDFDSHSTSPDYFSHNRRSSESNIAPPHHRPRSQNSSLHPGFPSNQNEVNHRRSRSDLTARRTFDAPALSQLVMQTFPVISQIQPSQELNIPTPLAQPSTSRIPVRGSKQSLEVRPTSTMAGAQRVTSPSNKNRPTESRENEKPQARRYNPPKLPQVTQLLSAKVVSPLPKVSPPLRSSRPRQPVSSATTAASRARAANTQQASPVSPTPRAKPSEQWLGKPYDPKQEKARRRIHEIGKIDFAERRERIQKAISRNLEESASVEQLRVELTAEAEAKQSQLPTHNSGAHSAANIVDQHQADILDAESQSLGLTRSRDSVNSPEKSLKLDTANLPTPAIDDDDLLTTANTEVTEIEIGDPPDSATDDYGQQTISSLQHQQDDLQLLSATTYVPPTRRIASPAPQLVSTVGPVASTTTQFASPESSPSDIEDRWGLKRGVDNTGSIRIMLDDDPTLLRLNVFSRNSDRQADEGAQDASSNVQALPDESPVVPQIFHTSRRNTSDPIDVSSPPLLAPTTFNPVAKNNPVAKPSVQSDVPVVMQVVNHYRSTGIILPEFMEEINKHTVDLHRMSANGDSDAALIQSLLDSIATQQLVKSRSHEPMPVTPHTPPDALNIAGTAIVFDHYRSIDATPDRQSNDAVIGSDDEDDFTVQIRKADAEWDRQQHGESLTFDDEETSRPLPPPKDDGYTPHSSIGPDNSSLEARWRHEGYRNSLSESSSVRNVTSKNVDSVISEEAIIPARVLTPSLPQHAPPPPPPTALRTDISDVTAGTTTEVEQNMVHSPRLQQVMNDAHSGSERPSVDSQRQDISHPASLSVSSLAESGRSLSHDINTDRQGRQGQTVSPGPEQKRLTKRKNIIRELLDTENTYHQDLKIIEDIYKATVADFVTPEDRKTLFGNCDEIERFSLRFYDQLRKAAASIYMPTKNGRWATRRGSMSTTQSDGQASSMSVDALDASRDKATYIGKVFLDNLVHMEQLYGAYLRNHDAANQRLSALQTSPTVKFWLDECHNNASDITSAWDLDSLLVKPTQRVSKYPLILQQLLEATPIDHPDHEHLKSAARDTVAMLTRINDAKKRADIVEQMISGKRKDTDVRSGIAKAFNRRTEKLKERVGINEAFQDPDFDALAQAFGGHYIRLQVTMRDFQDYVNQVEKAIQSTNNYAAAFELFTDVNQSSAPEIESKWRRYGQIIRELTAVSLTAHKAAVQKRVITPLIALIKVHDSPQRAINKRKKHIVDYAKCKSIEKRGERPDKKTMEASEMYEALNDQLKIELPKLYEMTGKLVVACLACFIESQLEWQQAFERKLGPLLDTKDVPKSIQDIVPAFNAEFDFVKSRPTELGVCNGSILADSTNFLSPSITADGGKSSMSDSPAPTPSNKRLSRTYTPDLPPAIETPVMPADMRLRSNSALPSTSTGHTPVTPIALLTAANRPWSNSVSSPPSSAYPSRPSTATAQTGAYSSFASSVRSSTEQSRDPRHDSSATYVTARDSDNHRFSGMFSSAMPPSESIDSLAGARAPSPVPPQTTASDDARVLFTCASLYEFQIDQTRKEAGYPYHAYETGAIFDVIGQKGELWLAVNQDDKSRTLGWIWEQHFVILHGGEHSG